MDNRIIANNSFKTSQLTNVTMIYFKIAYLWDCNKNIEIHRMKLLIKKS